MRNVPKSGHPQSVEEPQNQAPTPESYQFIGGVIPFTDEIRDTIKQAFGGRAKKVTLMGHTFVFLPYDRRNWSDQIEKWGQAQANAGKTVTPEQEDRKIIEGATIFPAVESFGNQAVATAWWASLPAGIEPQLADLIRYHSGFLVPEYVKESDLVVEDLNKDEDAEKNKPIKPTDEELEQMKAESEMPLRLCGFQKYFYVVRAARWSELSTFRKKRNADPDADIEPDFVRECLIWGDRNLENKVPGGIVTFLMNNIRQISGIRAEGEPILDVVVEDL